MVHPSRSTLEAKPSPDHAFYQVIQGAYRAFSCQTPIATGGCIDCCMEPEIEADFPIPPIADLPDDVLKHKLWRDWGRYSHRIWLTAFWEGSEKECALGFYTSQALYDRVVAVALEDKSAPELAQKAMVVSDVICAAADWATH